jgi:hypothetical protein
MGGGREAFGRAGGQGKWKTWGSEGRPSQGSTAEGGVRTILDSMDILDMFSFDSRTFVLYNALMTSPLRPPPLAATPIAYISLSCSPAIPGGEQLFLPFAPRVFFETGFVLKTRINSAPVIASDRRERSRSIPERSGGKQSPPAQPRQNSGINRNSGYTNDSIENATLFTKSALFAHFPKRGALKTAHFYAQNRIFSFSEVSRSSSFSGSIRRNSGYAKLLDAALHPISLDLVGRDNLEPRSGRLPAATTAVRSRGARLAAAQTEGETAWNPLHNVGKDHSYNLSRRGAKSRLTHPLNWRPEHGSDAEDSQSQPECR